MPKPIYKIILILTIAFFLIGLTELFSLRFQRGDVYPAYSSLRADPLGSKVLFESLGNFKDLTVIRNYQSLARLQGVPGSVLLYLGPTSEDFSSRERDFFESLDQYVAQGGRLVIAFQPTQWVRGTPLETNKLNKSTEKTKKEEGSHDENTRYLGPLEKQWGLAFEYQNSLKENAFIAKKYMQTQKTLNKFQSNLPSSLKWHSSLSLHLLNSSWHTLYTVNDKPVMLERGRGWGSIVMMTDSYFFSNEALLRDRQLPFLFAIFKGQKEIIFDEYHGGVINRRGIVDLMIKYRLHYFIISLFIIFILLIWKNSSLSSGESSMNSQVPIIESKKDYFEGLVSLLRKNISSRDILKVCIDEWYLSKAYVSKGVFRGIRADKDLKKFLEDILAFSKSHGITLVSGYQLIYKRLTERKRYE